MIRLINLLVLISVSLWTFAQSDTVRNVPLENYGLVKTNMGVGYMYNGGAISDQFTARVSYELLHTKAFSLTVNTSYNSIHCSFSHEDLSVPYEPVALGMNDTHISGQAGLSATARIRLLGCPFMAFGMASADWGNGRCQRISGIAMGLFMLRMNRNTQFGIGPLVMVNSTSKVPLFLVFMYRHRFNDKLALNLYGGMFGLDYSPTQNTMITAGFDINVRSFYFSPEMSGLPKHCRYQSTSFRPSIKLRRRLADNFYGELQGGVIMKMSSRVNGATGTKRYFEVVQKTRPFVQISASYSM